MLRTMVFILAFILARGAAPAGPRIFYSDLESGPNSGGENNAGAFVTIYGSGFGNAREASFVSIGGGKAAAYPIWTDGKIAFQLGGAAKTGDITVTTSNGPSNGLPFMVRGGKIYFVTANGSDSAAGSSAAPWHSLTKARDAMKAGDITYAKDGVTQPGDDGNGWSTSFLLFKGGKPGEPLALVAYPGASVTLGSKNVPTAIRSKERWEDGSGNWVFAGLKLTAGSDAVAIYGADNWRFIANEMTCPDGDGPTACFETSIVKNVKFLGNNVHDTGKATASALYHGVYFSTDSNHVEVGWNTIANVHGCRGLQFHSSPLMGGGPSDPTGHNMYDLVVHDNLIHDTQCDGIVLATVDPSKGKVELFNNVIYNAGQGPNNPDKTGNWACIYASGDTNTGPPGGGTIEVYNNTLVNCGSFARPPYDSSRGGVMNGGHNANLNIRLRNNIVLQGAGSPYVGGPRINGTNNLFFGNGGPPSALQNSISRDPGFANTAQKDFHLTGASPARKAGAEGGPVADKDGHVRTSADLGAFQYFESGTGK
jgi:hypothetical protein